MDGSSDMPAVADLPVLDRPWSEVLELPEHTATALESTGARTLRDVVLLSDRDLLGGPGFGRWSLKRLRKAVEDVIEDARASAPPAAEPPAPAPAALSALLASAPERVASAIEEQWLDLPWDQGLDLTVRVSNVLFQARCRTVRDVVGLSDRKLLSMRNFGRTSLRDLRVAIVRARHMLAVGPLPFIPLTFHDPVEHAPQRAPRPVPPPPTPTAAADPLDRPWAEALDLSIRAAHGLEKLGVVSVRDVLELDDRDMLGIPHFGRKSLREVKAELRRVAGAEPHRAPRGQDSPPRPPEEEPINPVVSPEPPAPVPEPEDLASLAAVVHVAMGHRDRRVFDLYWGEGRSLEQVGAEIGVCRERVRQRLARCECRAARLKGLIQKVLAPVMGRIEAAGGLLHADEVRAAAGPGRIEDVPFLARAAGLPELRVWNEAFLTTRTASDLRRRLGAARDALRHLRVESVPIDRAAAVLREVGGLNPGTAGLELLVRTGFGLETDGNSVRLDAILRPGERLIATLRKAGGPVRTADLAAQLGVVDDDQCRTPAQRVEAVLARYEEAWKIGPATYVHREHLPVPEERLTALSHVVAARLAAGSGPVGLARLVRDFVHDDPSLGRLTENLLGAALASHPSLVVRRGRVCLAELFREGGMTIGERAVSALEDAGAVMWLNEVVEAVNAGGLDYSPQSIHAILLHHPGVLPLTGLRFLARSALPVSAAEEQDLCDQAVTLLPEDGLPAVAGRLLRPLSERVWNRSVLRRIEVDGESDAVLWSLMRRRPDVDAAPGLLVARRADQRKKGMVWGLLLKALDELHAASQSQLTQHLGNNHGWSRSSDRLANVLSRQRDDGAVIRIPGGVYLRPDAALDGVFDALRHHHASILRAVRAGCSPATGTPELGILARYLYRSKEWSPALEVLDRLLARGDLPEADKREYGRLRQVARVRMEGPG